MKTYSIQEIFEHAKKESPFYRELYKNINFTKLSDLPILNLEQFWKSTIISTPSSGLVFKSGGSSGAPKYSYFTHEEWHTFTTIFGKGIEEGILEKNDRIANMFYAGDLYASFLFIKDSLSAIDPLLKPLTQFPISGAADIHETWKIIAEFDINVLAGVPSQLIKVIDYYSKNRHQFSPIKIDRLLFGGESLYPDQEAAFKEIFPHIQCSSIGIASVDGGLLGKSTRDSPPSYHRVFDHATMIEIVDIDTLEVIHEKGKIGKILLTNLTRKLMPIIRYPAGDLAMWTEDDGTPYRQFKLQGRADECARLGTLSIYFEDTREMIKKLILNTSGLQFQMLLTHFDKKDQLTLLIAGHELINEKSLVDKIALNFGHEKKVYLELVKLNLIHPLEIKIVNYDQLECNERTGKIKRIIDRRHSS